MIETCLPSLLSLSVYNNLIYRDFSPTSKNVHFHMLPNLSERKYNITFSCKFGNLLLLKMVSNK